MKSFPKEYEIVIGLEIHIQLKTSSKAFCGDPVRFGAEPNTLVSAISLGHPGTLPRANAEQIRSAVLLGLALKCKINTLNRFDRKNYFYPDLPKGYQVTQDQIPICASGELEIELANSKKTIRFSRIHMEEDAGKSIHDQNPEFSLLDLNRAGTPLLEAVTEPDLRSAEEAKVLLTEMRKLVRHLDICDGNMEEGSMRCDCNVSIRKKGDQEFGTRCEIKNVNSIRNAGKAIKYEASRQLRLIENGIEIDQETRSFNPETGDTETVLRTKEDAHDYRYFPDPDLPPVMLTQHDLEDIKSSMPELPWELKSRLINQYTLNNEQAEILSEEKAWFDYFIRMLDFSIDPPNAANWLINSVRSWLKENSLDIGSFPVQPENLVLLISLVSSKKISKLGATQQVFPALCRNPERDALSLAKELNLIQLTEEDPIQEWAEEALKKYPGKVEEYRRGRKGILGLFMGEVMKLSGGKANPEIANRILREKLEG